MDKLRKLVRLIRARLTFGRRMDRIAFLGPETSVRIGRAATVAIGHKVGIGKGCGIAVGAGATLTIGAGTDIQPRTRINATDRVEIGSGCAISWEVDILDSDFHTLRPLGKPPLANHAPVKIGDRVWIGTGAKILKGVTIGDDSMVAAGAVVTKSFAPRSLIAGVPARRVAEIDGWDP